MLPHQQTIITIMLLTELPKLISCKKIYNETKKKINFNSIYTNSKNIKKYSILAILENKRFKKEYIKEAINNGALAIITKKIFRNIPITQYQVEDINLSISILLNKLKSSAPLNSIAITGTNGKTSVAWYLSQVISFNNLNCKIYGTLGYYKNLKKINNSNLTTPEYEILQQCAYTKKKNTYNFVFEASSHSLDQNRFKNFPVDIAAITNITQDHLDYHKNFISYRNAKLKLFKQYLKPNGYAILNDRINGISELKKNITNKNKILTYGLQKSDIYLFKKENLIRLKIFNSTYLIKLQQHSSLDLENISCTIACCISLKIKVKNIINVLKNITTPPGRMQKIENKNYNVYVDYAHTPDALKQVLTSYTLDNIKPDLVFGCGGNRDEGKRSKMGSIANKFANNVYVTDDNPRNENPSIIRKTIIKNCKKAIEISDRKKAIIQAIKNLKRNHTLIIAGKGHENKQIIKNSLKLFDDKKIAKIALKAKKK